jgi:hypothetical protein
MPLSIDQHMTRYPITAYLTGYVLQDRTGQRLSFHRTVSGALRKRRILLEALTTGDYDNVEEIASN